MSDTALTIKRGDTFTRTLHVSDDDDAALDLAGATLTIHLRLPGATTDALAVALALTDAAGGVATLTLTAAQTAALAATRTYTYEVECVDALGGVTTPVEGLAYVAADFG